MSNLSELLPAGSGAKVAEFVASGTLATGQAVALRSDGKVEAIAISPESVGSAVVFEAATSNHISTTFDSASNKVVIAYQDSGNSGYGTAIVGTVSGSSISFGTPTIFVSTESDNIASTVDTANNKVVIAYRKLSGSDPGKAVVGTVSGTSISFGSEAQFNSDDSRNVAITYDSTNKKVVVAYQDYDNSSYGTAAVGTVSGTSISFGSEVVFESATTDNIGIAYDSSANRVVIAYRDNQNNEYGTAIVGTVSGTNISFGTAVVYTSINSLVNSVCYDPTNAKIVIAFYNAAPANSSRAIVGTVSGTAISFGTLAEFNPAATGERIGLVYVPTTEKIAITYADIGNSSYGTLVNATISGTSISFSSEIVFSAASTAYPSPAYTADGKVAIAYKNQSNSSYGTGVVFSSVSSNNTDFVGITNAAISNSATGEVAVQGGIATLAGGTYAVTVANPGSGNRYYIDGILQQTLNLREGFTYKFDQSAGSNSGHPLRFSTTSNGTHAGGSEYTTGVTTAGTPGSAGAYTQIVVAAGAPTLYYYCTNHSLMGGTANTLTGIVTNSNYFVQDDGTLTTTTSAVPAGRALSTTSILLEG